MLPVGRLHRQLSQIATATIATVATNPHVTPTTMYTSLLLPFVCLESCPCSCSVTFGVFSVESSCFSCVEFFFCISSSTAVVVLRSRPNIIQYFSVNDIRSVTHNLYYWRNQSKGGAKDAHPLQPSAGSNFFHVHAVLGKILPKKRFLPHLWVCRPPWEILDPPLIFPYYSKIACVYNSKSLYHMKI